MIANELFETMTEAERAFCIEWFQSIAHSLYRNEVEYSEVLYSEFPELLHEAKKFIRYNFNILCDNLHLERLFGEEEVLASVVNGISTNTKTHDFFSTKGSGYQKIVVESLRDSDFEF